jgi:hypothetical protein
VQTAKCVQRSSKSSLFRLHRILHSAVVAQGVPSALGLLYASTVIKISIAGCIEVEFPQIPQTNTAPGVAPEIGSENPQG